MLSWALTFLVIAICAALLGFTGVAVAATQIAKIIFIIFLILFIITSLMHVTKTSFALLSWVLTFFILAIVAGALGFIGVAFISAEIGRALFFVFIVLFIVSLIMHINDRSKPK